jgi:hypothetical protein
MCEREEGERERDGEREHNINPY